MPAPTGRENTGAAACGAEASVWVCHARAPRRKLERARTAFSLSASTAKVGGRRCGGSLICCALAVTCAARGRIFAGVSGGPWWCLTALRSCADACLVFRPDRSWLQLPVYFLIRCESCHGSRNAAFLERIHSRAITCPGSGCSHASPA